MLVKFDEITKNARHTAKNPLMLKKNQNTKDMKNIVVAAQDHNLADKKSRRKHMPYVSTISSLVMCQLLIHSFNCCSVCSFGGLGLRVICKTARTCWVLVGVSPSDA